MVWVSKKKEEKQRKEERKVEKGPCRFGVGREALTWRNFNSVPASKGCGALGGLGGRLLSRSAGDQGSYTLMLHGHIDIDLF